jgi:subtilisin
VLDFGDRGKTVSGRFPEEALEALERRPDVRYVEADGQYEAIGETMPWGVDRVDADLVHDAGETGGDDTDGEGGADVAIIDSGIDDDHPDLSANLGDGVAYADCDGSDCNYDWSDDHGHGTHCAGIAGAVDNDRGTIGVAPGVTLHAVKVLAEDGQGYYSDIAAGVQWVADKGYDVASLSLGGSSSSSTLRDACQYADDNGVLVVGAAGNEGPCSDCVLYPARYSSVVAVSATESDDDLADFSSTGPEVELAAPGQYIYSTVPGGYERWSGTSMACPHVSGAGAQLMDNGHSSAEARAELRETAEDIGLGSNQGGSGLLDVEAALSDSADSSLDVSTVGALDVGETTATLEGSLDDLGGASSADVAFEYRRSGASTWSTTRSETRSSTGSFSRDVSDLASDTEYEYRARVDASDGDAATGSIRTLTTVTEPALAVSTVDSSGVGETTATLKGSLDALGGASSADVGFEYRQSGASSWSATATETRSSSGSFSREISALESGTDYEFRAVADASDGDTATGSTLTFTTNTDPSVAVSTVGSSNVGETAATLEGSLDALGGASSADVGFEYRQSGASSWSATATATRSSSGSFSREISGLESATDYEFRAVADASDGDSATGSTLSFTTQESSGGDTAPVIDSYTVTEAGSPNPHAEITADWAVSDADGDLQRVDIVVSDGSGTVDSKSTSVGGSSAAGSTAFKIKHGGGTSYDVTCTVRDSNGNTDSETQSVSSGSGRGGN